MFDTKSLLSHESTLTVSLFTCWSHFVSCWIKGRICHYRYLL